MKDWTVASARAFVQTVHDGHADEQGRPLRAHLDAVRDRVEEMGGEEIDQIAALLHHAALSGDISITELAAQGVPHRAVAIVDALTPRPHETEDETLRRVMDTPGAVRVLRADLAHQLHPDQLQCVPAEAREATLYRCCRILDELDKEPELTFN